MALVFGGLATAFEHPAPALLRAAIAEHVEGQRAPALLWDWASGNWLQQTILASTTTVSLGRGVRQGGRYSGLLFAALAG